MAIYTTSNVERLLRSYLDIKQTLETRGQILPDLYTMKPKPRSSVGLPFGQTPSGKAWPFMEPQRAKAPTDGKRQARQMEELHVCCLDIEEALPKVTDDDLELLYKFYIFQTHTLDDLVAERKVTSRGSMRQRCHRAVERLTRVLEYG
jgi:hypothetical protein